MAMFECPGCKHIVDDSIKKCPNCSYDIKKYVKAMMKDAKKNGEKLLSKTKKNNFCSTKRYVLKNTVNMLKTVGLP